MPKKKGGKKKGSKKGKKKGGAKKGVLSTGILLPTPKAVYIPQYNETLLHLLTTHKVEEKELHNMMISTRALEELTPQDIRDLRVVFDVFDTNFDGFLSADEVTTAMRSLGFQVKLTDVEIIMKDWNISANVDFNAFLDFVIDRQNDGRDYHDEIMDGFKHLDLDETGQISLANLKVVCKKVGLKLSENELKEMIEEADTNGDNMVDKEEFLKIMLQTNLFQ